MRTGCWPGGTFCWANSQLHSNTDRDPYTITRMECLGSVVNVGGQTARFQRADLPTIDADAQSALVDQPFATSEMGDSMDADLLPELSGETWVASALLDELTVDLPAAGVEMNWSRIQPKTKYYKQCGHGWNLELLHRG